MFGKRNMAIITVFAIILVFVPVVQAQSVSSPLPDNFTYQDIIKLFPADLQSGFFAMYTIMSSVSEKSALTSLLAYYLIHLVKEEYITKGRGSKVTDDGKTVMEGNMQRRVALLANIGNLLTAVPFYGNPGGTNWDVWYARLTEWL